MLVQPNKLIISIRVISLYFGTIVTKTIIIISVGKVIKKSIILINKLSIQPPKYPHINPINIPNDPVNNVIEIAIFNEFFAPIINWAKTSLPPISAPNQNSLLGGAYLFLKDVFITSAGSKKKEVIKT